MIFVCIYIVLIVAKCIVNVVDYFIDSEKIAVLIVAKCIVKTDYSLIF
nr:MAG TPA: hypothetical protein [Caudoviricetes sp.]